MRVWVELLCRKCSHLGQTELALWGYRHSNRHFQISKLNSPHDLSCEYFAENSQKKDQIVSQSAEICSVCTTLKHVVHLIIVLVRMTCTELNYKQVNVRCNKAIFQTKLWFHFWTVFKNWQRDWSNLFSFWISHDTLCKRNVFTRL